MLKPHHESYRTIPLTQGKVTIVSVRDFKWLSQWKWCAHFSRCVQSFYAYRAITLRPGRRVHVAMHRLILGLEFGDRKQGDHRNGDTLDNRRLNLRVATQAQNSRNTGVQRHNTSGYKGVTWNWNNENGTPVSVLIESAFT